MLTMDKSASMSRSNKTQSMSLGYHTFSKSFPTTNQHSNSNCSFLTGPSLDTQIFGYSLNSLSRNSQTHFPLQYSQQLFLLLWSPTAILLPVLWIESTNAEAIEEMANRNTSTTGAVQSNLTSLCSAEEKLKHTGVNRSSAALSPPWTTTFI